MKTRLLLSLLFLIILQEACNFNSAPKCTDAKVKNLVMDITIEELKNQYLQRPENAMISLMAMSTSNTYQQIILEGSMAQGGGNYKPSYKDLKKHEKDDKTIYAIVHNVDSIFADNSDITLESIRVDDVDKGIKKCNCSADIVSGENKVPISYSAQYTEEGKLYVTVSGLN